MSLVFFDRFFFMNILYLSMLKFQSFAQFFVDNISHRIILSLVLILCKFVAFAYYVINRFISFYAQPTFAIQLRIICFRFNTISPNSVFFFFVFFFVCVCWY